MKHKIQQGQILDFSSRISGLNAEDLPYLRKSGGVIQGALYIDGDVSPASLFISGDVFVSETLGIGPESDGVWVNSSGGTSAVILSSNKETYFPDSYSFLRLSGSGGVFEATQNSAENTPNIGEIGKLSFGAPSGILFVVTGGIARISERGFETSGIVKTEEENIISAHYLYLDSKSGVLDSIDCSKYVGADYTIFANSEQITICPVTVIEAGVSSPYDTKQEGPVSVPVLTKRTISNFSDPLDIEAIRESGVIDVYVKNNIFTNWRIRAVSRKIKAAEIAEMSSYSSSMSSSKSSVSSSSYSSSSISSSRSSSSNQSSESSRSSISSSISSSESSDSGSSSSSGSSSLSSNSSSNSSLSSDSSNSSSSSKRYETFLIVNDSTFEYGEPPFGEYTNMDGIYYWNGEYNHGGRVFAQLEDPEKRILFYEINDSWCLGIKENDSWQELGFWSVELADPEILPEGYVNWRADFDPPISENTWIGIKYSSSSSSISSHSSSSVSSSTSSSSSSSVQGIECLEISGNTSWPQINGTYYYNGTLINEANVYERQVGPGIVKIEKEESGTWALKVYGSVAARYHAGGAEDLPYGAPIEIINWGSSPAPVDENTEINICGWSSSSSSGSSASSSSNLPVGIWSSRSSSASSEMGSGSSESSRFASSGSSISSASSTSAGWTPPRPPPVDRDCDAINYGLFVLSTPDGDSDFHGMTLYPPEGSFDASYCVWGIQPQYGRALSGTPDPEGPRRHLFIRYDRASKEWRAVDQRWCSAYPFQGYYWCEDSSRYDAWFAADPCDGPPEGKGLLGKLVLIPRRATMCDKLR